LIWLLSTSIVAPNLLVSAASWLLKMMARIEVLPDPDLPIRRIYRTARGELGRRGDEDKNGTTDLLARWGGFGAHSWRWYGGTGEVYELF
jgi:hypothetical protein